MKNSSNWLSNRKNNGRVVIRNQIKANICSKQNKRVWCNQDMFYCNKYFNTTQRSIVPFFLGSDQFLPSQTEVHVMKYLLRLGVIRNVWKLAHINPFVLVGVILNRFICVCVNFVCIECVNETCNSLPEIKWRISFDGSDRLWYIYIYCVNKSAK